MADIQGRYMTRVKYLNLGDGVRDIYYEPTLHRLAPPFIVHDIDAYEAATEEASTPATADWVNVSLAYSVFKELEKRGMSPGDSIPGTVWKPAYVWPDPVIDPLVPVSAPQAEIDAFVQAGVDLKAALTQNIVRHWKTHIEVVDDPVVRVADWVMDIAIKAERVLKG